MDGMMCERIKKSVFTRNLEVETQAHLDCGRGVRNERSYRFPWVA